MFIMNFAMTENWTLIIKKSKVMVFSSNWDITYKYIQIQIVNDKG